MKKIFYLLSIIILSNIHLRGETLTGNLMGRVIDAESNYPLAHANVIIIELNKGAITNEKGQYHIYDIPVGSYSVSIQLIGFQPQVKTDVVIRSDRTTFINGYLRRQSIQIEGISAETSYFAPAEEENTSVINFSNEEIRRAPGSAGRSGF